MGLDLTIRTESEITTNDKGQNTWVVTQIGNLRNCWKILEEVQNYTELANCTTATIYGKHFHKILEDLKAELTNTEENHTDDYNFQNERANYTYEINELEKLIKENNIEDNDLESYEVHAWW